MKSGDPLGNTRGTGLFCLNRRRLTGPVQFMAAHPINDYYVVTSQRSARPDRWGWEIHRKSNPLGIKMIGEGYQSEAVARLAGKQALADFLFDLLKEEQRK